MAEEIQIRRTKPSISSQFHSKHTHSITDVESVLGCKKLHVKRNPHKIHEEFIQSLLMVHLKVVLQLVRTQAESSMGGRASVSQSFLPL